MRVILFIQAFEHFWAFVCVCVREKIYSHLVFRIWLEICSRCAQKRTRKTKNKSERQNNDGIYRARFYLYTRSITKTSKFCCSNQDKCCFWRSSWNPPWVSSMILSDKHLEPLWHVNAACTKAACSQQSGEMASFVACFRGSAAGWCVRVHVGHRSEKGGATAGNTTKKNIQVCQCALQSTTDIYMPVNTLHLPDTNHADSMQRNIDRARACMCILFTIPDRKPEERPPPPENASLSSCSRQGNICA